MYIKLILNAGNLSISFVLTNLYSFIYLQTKIFLITSRNEKECQIVINYKEAFHKLFSSYSQHTDNKHKIIQFIDK